jgi:hypothetical protein
MHAFSGELWAASAREARYGELRRSLRRRRAAIAAALIIMVVPSLASAQASIAGTVKDTPDALLPGVTVEASSPALIEKVRTAVTDGTGQYRIENLRPGIYTVKFVLTGFSTVSREGVEVSGSATVSINADMRVGSLEETITVTGEACITTRTPATRMPGCTCRTAAGRRSTTGRGRTPAAASPCR